MSYEADREQHQHQQIINKQRNSNVKVNIHTVPRPRYAIVARKRVITRSRYLVPTCPKIGSTKSCCESVWTTIRSQSAKNLLAIVVERGGWSVERGAWSLVLQARSAPVTGTTARYGGYRQISADRHRQISVDCCSCWLLAATEVQQQNVTFTIPSLRTFVGKLSHGWLTTIGVRERRYSATTDLWPQCNEIETVPHLYRRHVRGPWRHRFLIHFHGHLTETKTAADISCIIIKGIES
jgi:hypothetical protein